VSGIEGIEMICTAGGLGKSKGWVIRQDDLKRCLLNAMLVNAGLVASSSKVAG